MCSLNHIHVSAFLELMVPFVFLRDILLWGLVQVETSELCVRKNYPNGISV